MKIDNNDELQNFQQDIDNLCDWSEKWSLPFNCNKCKFLPIEVNTEDDSLFTQEGLGRVKLSKCSNEKDLGIIIDDKLNFKCHINTIVKSSNRLVGLIRRTFKNMGPEIFYQFVQINY